MPGLCQQSKTESRPAKCAAVRTEPLQADRAGATAEIGGLDPWILSSELGDTNHHQLC